MMRYPISTYLILSRQSNFDWDGVGGAEKWALKNVGSEKNWMDDPGEKARRIWEWWRIHREKCVYFKTAVHLVVLVQVSSAPVERVFSRLRLIVETLQQHTLHDAILLRLFVAINGKYVMDV
jgi:hypothetical protein